MREHVPNELLRIDALPAENAPWQEISPFALSFHAYDHWHGAPALSYLANGAVRMYKASGAVPDTLTALRACLFFEHRRKVHIGDDLSEEKLRYVHALLRAIRDKVARGDRD